MRLLFLQLVQEFLSSEDAALQRHMNMLSFDLLGEGEFFLQQLFLQLKMLALAKGQ